MLQLKLLERQNLTPQDLDPAVYLASFSAETSIEFQPGDWLTLKGSNTSELVAEFLELMQLDSEDSVELRRLGTFKLEDALLNELELTFLDPALLNKLERQLSLGIWPDRASMQAYAKSKDVLDLLQEYPQITQLGKDFIGLLSPLFPRYYSIANAPNAAGKVSVLYKHIATQVGGRTKFGVTTNWLTNLEIGAEVQAEIKPNPQFHLPEDKSTPVVMLGAGTGLAPFLSLLEQRVLDEAKNNWLIFGETKKASRFLMQEQLEAWQVGGYLDLDTAFSRDQEEKIYVQDILLENAAKWLEIWEKGGITYVCGAKDGIGAGVEQVIKQIWQQAYSWDDEQLTTEWNNARKSGHIKLDIY